MDLVPNIVNWASLMLFMGFTKFGFSKWWGIIIVFLSIFKRLTDNFIQNWRARLEESSRANFYKTFAIFQLQSYLDKFTASKFSHAFSRLRMSSHRQDVESGRWAKPQAVCFNERKCVTCLVVEDEYHFVLECPCS